MYGKDGDRGHAGQVMVGTHGEPSVSIGRGGERAGLWMQIKPCREHMISKVSSCVAQGRITSPDSNSLYLR